MKVSPLPVDEMAARYRKCASATIFDVLDRMDMPNQCLSLEIKPLTLEMHVAGPAFTVRGTREPREDHELPQRDKFADWGIFKPMFPGCVVTINAEREDQTGQWGEMMSYAARQAGASGVVIDGGTRDLLGLIRIPGWPMFTRYTSPIESSKRWQAEDLLCPIYMSGTLTRLVRVDPGDWIVGDADGVMVVPQAVAYEALLRAEGVEEREAGTRRDLAAGISIYEVFAKYGRM